MSYEIPLRVLNVSILDGGSYNLKVAVQISVEVHKGELIHLLKICFPVLHTDQSCEYMYKVLLVNFM